MSHAPSIHLALGAFDGVHLGHRAVLHSARAAARQLLATLTARPATTPAPPPSHLFVNNRLEGQALETWLAIVSPPAHKIPPTTTST